MTERFTPGARAVVFAVQEEARTPRQANVGSEHVLLGILRDGHGPAWQALRDIGVDLAALRGGVERRLPAEAA